MLSSLVPTAPGTRLTIEQTVTAIEEGVVITPRAKVITDNTVIAAPANFTADMALLSSDKWQWSDLRDYVIRKIEETCGQVPRQASYKEQAIFEGFLKRHGQRAPQIVRYAFEVAGGYWRNAPISVNRFCANSDPYFSDVIKRHLEEVEQAVPSHI